MKLPMVGAGRRAAVGACVLPEADPKDDNVGDKKGATTRNVRLTARTTRRVAIY